MCYITIALLIASSRITWSIFVTWCPAIQALVFIFISQYFTKSFSKNFFTHHLTTYCHFPLFLFLFSLISFCSPFPPSPNCYGCVWIGTVLYEWGLEVFWSIEITPRLGVSVATRVNSSAGSQNMMKSLWQFQLQLLERYVDSKGLEGYRANTCEWDKCRWGIMVRWASLADRPVSVLCDFMKMDRWHFGSGIFFSLTKGINPNRHLSIPCTDGRLIG